MSAVVHYVLAMSCAALPARGAHAQRSGDSAPALTAERGPLPPGTRVRVTASSAGLDRATLTVAEQRGDTLVLRGREQLYFLACDQLQRLERSRGTVSRSAGAGRGALIGFAIGAVPTVVGTAMAYRADQRAGDVIIPGSVIVAVFGAGLTALTTATGGIIGYNRPSERWEPATLRVGVAPGPGRVGLAIRTTF